MNFSEKLDKFVERGAEKYTSDIIPVISNDDEADLQYSYKSGCASLKPIVLKLYQALDTAIELSHVPEHCQDDEWFEKRDNVVAVFDEVEKMIEVDK